MRRALTYVAVAAALGTPCFSAERNSWNMVRYVGGTVPVKTSRYDWNTTLTVNHDAILVVIAPATVFAPQKTVRIKPSQVVSLSGGQAAWRHVAAVDGAKLPAKPPTLFGLLLDSGFLGLVYETDDGKRAAMLLDSNYTWAILPALTKVTGKAIENSP
jgi:hypothetical protein